jgi:hypothetical protein
VAAAGLVHATLQAALAMLAKRGPAVAHVLLLDAPLHRRQLMQADEGGAGPPPAPPPAMTILRPSAAKFNGGMAALGVTVMLVASMAGAITCLCMMPTGQDTLLYARTKAD